MAGRERTKTNCVKLIEETRVALREWGRRCCRRHVPRPSSFGMLTRPEVFQFLDDPTGWCDVLAQREALYDEVAALQEPFLFVGHPGPMSEYPASRRCVLRFSAPAVCCRACRAAPARRAAWPAPCSIPTIRRIRAGRHSGRPDHGSFLDAAGSSPPRQWSSTSGFLSVTR